MLRGVGTLLRAVFGAIRFTKTRSALACAARTPLQLPAITASCRHGCTRPLACWTTFPLLQFDELRILPDFGSGQPTVQDRVSCRVSAQALFIVIAAVRVLYEFWRKKVLDIFL